MSKEGQRVKVSDQIMFLMSWVRVIQVTVSDICSEQSSNRKCKEWNQSKTVSSVLLVLTRRRFYWHWQHQWWEGTVAVMGAGEDHLQLQGDGVVAPALSMLGCGTLISLKRMQSVITVVMGREVGRLRRTLRTVVRMRDQCGGGWRLPRLSRGSERCWEGWRRSQTRPRPPHPTLAPVVYESKIKVLIKVTNEQCAAPVRAVSCGSFCGAQKSDGREGGGRSRAGRHRRDVWRCKDWKEQYSIQYYVLSVVDTFSECCAVYSEHCIHVWHLASAASVSASPLRSISKVVVHIALCLLAGEHKW